MDAGLKILWFAFFYPLFFYQSWSQSPSDEKQTLLSIKSDWGNITELSSWKPDGDHCEYVGIRCSGGSVVEIELYNSNISFPIPASICELKALTFLNLSYNNIPGEFPSALYNCSSLQKLDISDNYFVGELPADIHKMPRNLTHLFINGNNFTGDIPSSIGRLPAIKLLRLNYNLFNGKIPWEIGNLSTLETLGLALNPFPPTRIPPEFGNLTKLQFLYMSQMNLIGEIPESLGKLQNLEHLDLTMNFLVGEIPASVWMIKSLKVLFLYANKLTGEISKIAAATGLTEIDLSTNHLTGSIPEVFGEMKNLSSLLLYRNNLSGQIPASIGRLPNIYDLRLFSNKLEGVLPSEMGMYSRLWNFEVSDNKFTGELPEHLCAGKALMNLIVFNNQLTGNLPESLGSCTALFNVQIQNNGFTGNFPSGIWLANDLTLLYTQQNSLTGTLPERLPWNLTRLQIQNNQFSGNIPSSSGGLLVFLGDDNKLSGNIPASFFEKSSLQYLSLSGNQFSGIIPATVGTMKGVNVLDLSNNHLSGSIPDTIGSLPLLNALDLSRNQLIGDIPSELGDLKLSSLNLSFNSLSGEIPGPLQIQAYEFSFFSNQDLCSSHSFANIQTCTNHSKNSFKHSPILLILFSVLGALLFSSLVLLGYLIARAHRRREKPRAFPPDWRMTSFHAVDFDECAIFDGLTNENLVGSGGGGKVYRISLGRVTVAVKKMWNSRKLDSRLEKEFQAEVETLGSIRHSNIVKLLFCISGKNSMLLVYEYLENGSLDRWLHRRSRGNAPPLDWPTRLQIAIGAARGLCYMHHNCFPAIIHRDVKSSNILLDHEFNPKIADFGLARILAKRGEPETVSAVAGSFGYMAPECAKLRKVNEKVDVYSFGVVLLELATGREAGDGGEEEDENLADWAWRRYQERGGAVGYVVDDEIVGGSPECAEEAVVVFRMGVICTGYDPACRPTMKEVLQVLLKLGSGREASRQCGGGGGSSTLESKCMSGSRRKKIADIMDDSDDSGVGRYMGIDSLL